MQYRRLGRTGLKLSALSFGSWVTFSNQVDRKQAETMLAAAYEAGVNFFDNSESYAHGRSEELMGEALKQLGFARDTWCVSSKVFFGRVPDPRPTQRGLARKHVVEACHAALRRLQVDHLDLFFCHRPDPETPTAEVVRTMNALIAQGKVLYWGTSEWSAPEIAEAHAIAERLGLEPPAMEQPQYNLFHRRRMEVEYAPLFRDLGIGTTVWSPLASGVLAGKYANGIPDDSRVRVKGYEWLQERVTSELGRARVRAANEAAALARELDATPAQLALAWCLAKPNVSTVILGASRPAQLQENLGALAVRERLNDAVVARLEKLTEAAAE
ncbi:MAG TPA: aldo/keto reductase [Gammaproteobacteria bacterium]|nr:aldo/keto reductase [Gammaproteobacteria bacterium]